MKSKLLVPGTVIYCTLVLIYDLVFSPSPSALRILGDIAGVMLPMMIVALVILFILFILVCWIRYRAHKEVINQMIKTGELKSLLFFGGLAPCQYRVNESIQKFLFFQQDRPIHVA